MLYAGTTLTLFFYKKILHFKYSIEININNTIFNDTVKKLKWKSLSAGNIFNIKNETSETLCNEIVVNTENIKPISVHVPKHIKPKNDDQFGQYLAGLIDGNGQFNSKQQLVIKFNPLDASLAYFIKKRLGYGSVKKVLALNAYILVVESKQGIEKVINLINGKIRTKIISHQITDYILNHINYAEFSKNITLELNERDKFKNHWLAGFCDACASFNIKISKESKINQVRLNFQIDHTDKDLLLFIKNFLGGNNLYSNSKDTYFYLSTSFGSALNVINYFDRFHLLSSKHVNYLKWRKAYLIIQNKDHLNKDGFEKIIKLKITMDRFNHTTI